MAGVSRVGRSRGTGVSRVAGTQQGSSGRDGGADLNSSGSNAGYRGGRNEARYIGPRPGGTTPTDDYDLVLEEVNDFV